MFIYAETWFCVTGPDLDSFSVIVLTCFIKYTVVLKSSEDPVNIPHIFRNIARLEIGIVLCKCLIISHVIQY